MKAKTQTNTNLWHASAEHVFSLSIYPNGLSASYHKRNQIFDDSDNEITCRPLFGNFHLKLKETKSYQIPNGKSFVYKENPLGNFEQFLIHYSKQNILQKSVFYFGLTSDPFWSFDKKIKLTMGCLELLEKYQAGFVVMQTRSPLVIAALPFIKYMADRVVVAINVETRLESVVAQYTPGQPKIASRLLAADSLRSLGVKVNLVAAPILPYGDYVRDAWGFAELLDRYADYVTLDSLTSGMYEEEVQLRDLALTKKLSYNDQIKFLRPLAHMPVYVAMKEVAPDKLVLPEVAMPQDRQLSLFAA